MVVGLVTTPRRLSVLPVIPVNVMVIPGITRTTVTAWVAAQIKAAKTAIRLTPLAATGIAAAVAPTPTRTPQRCVWAPAVPTVAPKRKSLTATVRVRVAMAAARPAVVAIAVRVAVAPAPAHQTASAATPVATTAPVLAASVITARVVVVPVTATITPTARVVPVSIAAAPSVRATQAVGTATITTEITPCVAVPVMTITTTARVITPAGVVSKRVVISPRSNGKGTFQKVYG